MSVLQFRPILYDGSHIWVTDGLAPGKLFKLDAAGAILQTVTVGAAPGFPAFDGANLRRSPPRRTQKAAKTKLRFDAQHGDVCTLLPEYHVCARIALNVPVHECHAIGGNRNTCRTAEIGPGKVRGAFKLEVILWRT